MNKRALIVCLFVVVFARTVAQASPAVANLSENRISPFNGYAPTNNSTTTLGHEVGNGADLNTGPVVSAGFDIANVKLLKWTDGVYVENAQPLTGEDVDIEARVANPRLLPSNIVMWVSYYVGTNVWGIGNWPAAQTVTKRMHPIDGDPSLYRTRHDNGGVIDLEEGCVGPIPSQNDDAVVQYCVWATYWADEELTQQQNTFTNPSWYFPVDLNTTYGMQGWSPYYCVYSVPRNAVWINEVNASDLFETGIGGNQYVEIAMPAWMDLAGWGVDFVTSSSYTTKTVTIPSGLAAQTAVTNGYAFFVMGNAVDADGIAPLPKRDYGCDGLNGMLPYVIPGGLRLKRPLGMYEQTIAYDWQPSFGSSFSGTNWVAKDPQKRFVYVGQEYYGGALGKTGLTTLSTVDSTNTWAFPQTWTPGAPNVNQIIDVNADTLQPGVSNVYVTSVMNLHEGMQNDRSAATYTLKLHAGDSTNVFYQIHDWYRMCSLSVNGAEALNADERSAGVRSYTLPLNDLRGDVAVNATVRLRSDLAQYQGTPDMLNWILGCPSEATFVPSRCNGRVMSMTELYWLDVNPTVTNDFRFETAGFKIDAGTNLYLTVGMSINDGKQTSLRGGAVLKLRAKTSLSDPDWALVAQYSLVESSFDSNRKCLVRISNPFDVLLKGMDPLKCFFQWAIETEDPSIAVTELIDGR